MLNTVSAVVVFEVVLQAVEDAAQILGLLPVAEGDELQEGVERQRRERQWLGRLRSNRRDGVGHDMVEAGHVEDEAFFELETPIRCNRLAERKKVDESSDAMLHPMRRARASEAEGRKAVLQRLEVGEALRQRRSRPRRWSSRRAERPEGVLGQGRPRFRMEFRARAGRAPDRSRPEPGRAQCVASSRTLGKSSSAASSACPVPRYRSSA